MGNGFGEVPHRVITLVKKPIFDARHLAGQRAQRRRAHHLPGFAARQKIHRPGRVFRAGQRKVALQGLDLGVGRGGRVKLGEERGELFHAFSPDELGVSGVSSVSSVSSVIGMTGVPDAASVTSGLATTCSSTGSSPYSV